MQARIKFEIEQGTWGASGLCITIKLFTEVDNPKETGVEIDIIEFVPQDNNYGVHNLHSVMVNSIKLKAVGD